MNFITISYSVCYKHIAFSTQAHANMRLDHSDSSDNEDAYTALLLPDAAQLEDENPISKSWAAWYLEDIQKSPTDSNAIMGAYFIFNCFIKEFLCLHI